MGQSDCPRTAAVGNANKKSGQRHELGGNEE